jgi:hypothetical protein
VHKFKLALVRKNLPQGTDYKKKEKESGLKCANAAVAALKIDS